jgi:hypothetical protein
MDSRQRHTLAGPQTRHHHRRPRLRSSPKFQNSSQNISCNLGSGGAVCEIGNRAYTISTPPPPCAQHSVHSEVFGEIRPAATMVEVAALIAPELLVEIEADAYSTADSPTGGKLPSAPGR